jgi:hypothetical protein
MPTEIRTTFVGIFVFSVSLQVSSLLRKLPKPSGRHPDVLAMTSAQPPNRVAEVVSASEYDQCEGTVLQHRLYLGIVASR